MEGSPSGYFQYRSPFGDTTLTKVFVGGLAWETPTEKMREYFEQFGEILEAVIICDKNTGKSKGYGFVTFRDPESAKRAVTDANPMIDGRRANCNIAATGRPRQSPPRGRGQGQSGQIYYPGTHGGGSSVQGPMVAAPPPVQPSVPMMYPPYGYTTYNPQYGYYNQAAAVMYNQQLQQQAAQYYQQMYGSGSSSSTSPTIQQQQQQQSQHHHPYYYALAMQAAAAASRAAAATGGSGGAYPSLMQQGQRVQNPYFYYSSPVNQSTLAGAYGESSTRVQLLPSQIESNESSHVTSPEAEAKVAPSDSPPSE